MVKDKYMENRIELLKEPSQASAEGPERMRKSFFSERALIGRFAVVKLWPEIKTAEDECIARLKIAAEAIGAECFEISADGHRLDQPDVKISQKSVDFVIHLHYDTPKNYDAFSFVALWNPINFFLEWGYARTSRNLTTHDDFLSCSSDAADHHVARMVRGTLTHLPPKFHLYHSTAAIVHPPSLGDGKLLYVGINWEAISGGKSRHQEVLKILDKSGLLRIFGPHIFQGVQVWAGYDSYVREVPFDGTSLINEISKAGAALVLSSQSHKEAALMSNRLFESIAAGALVICDENPFAKKFFGDSLLYIDSRSSPEEMVTDIKRHLAWAQTHSVQALGMIEKAQAIFREKFNLTKNLSDIYTGLQQRKLELVDLRQGKARASIRVQVNFLMPIYSKEILDCHLKSAESQDYKNCTSSLIIDRNISASQKDEITQSIFLTSAPINVIEVDYFNYGIHPEIKTRRRTGEIIYELLISALGTYTDALMIIAPNEALLSNHVSVLAGALVRSNETHCAATAAILTRGSAAVHGVHELIDFGHVNRDSPTGLGRFIFRLSSIPKDIEIALPYLDGRPLAVLIGGKKIDQQLAATIQIDLQHEFPERTWNDTAENEIIRDFDAGAFNLRFGFGPRPEKEIKTQIVPPPQNTQPITLLQLIGRLLNPYAIAAQIRAVRQFGLRNRFLAVKTRLGL